MILETVGGPFIANKSTLYVVAIDAQTNLHAFSGEGENNLAFNNLSLRLDLDCNCGNRYRRRVVSSVWPESTLQRWQSHLGH